MRLPLASKRTGSAAGHSIIASFPYHDIIVLKGKAVVKAL